MIPKYLSALATALAIGGGPPPAVTTGGATKPSSRTSTSCARATSNVEATSLPEHFSDDQRPTVEQLQAFYADFAPLYAETAEEPRGHRGRRGRRRHVRRLRRPFRRNAETLARAAMNTESTQHLLETDEAELHEGEELSASRHQPRALIRVASSPPWPRRVRRFVSWPCYGSTGSFATSPDTRRAPLPPGEGLCPAPPEETALEASSPPRVPRSATASVPLESSTRTRRRRPRRHDRPSKLGTIAAVLAAEAEQPPEPAHVAAARRALRELPVELDRVLDAIRAGMDPQLATATTRKIQTELAAAEATLAAWDAEHDDRSRSPPTTSPPRSTTPATSLPSLGESGTPKRGPGCTGPSISTCNSIRSRKPWRLGCSYMVAGAGFEPATFGL